MIHQPRAALFDLDGTLLDTAPDLVFALNKLRREHDLPEMPVATLRSIANLGSKAMIKLAFGMEEDNPEFAQMREKFLTYYTRHIADSTRFFPDMENVLAQLEQCRIPWGIVTNKLTRHTTELLKALNIAHRPACVICGDSLPTFKPDPGPILHACKLLEVNPEHCIYVGDAATDVTASRAAGTRSLVALYGYIHENEDPYSWNADGYIREPMDIMDYFKS